MVATCLIGAIAVVRPVGADRRAARIGGKNDTIACDDRVGADATVPVPDRAAAVVLLQNLGGCGRRAVSLWRKSWAFQSPAQPARGSFAADFLQMQQTAKPSVDSGGAGAARPRLSVLTRFRVFRSAAQVTKNATATKKNSIAIFVLPTRPSW